MTTEVNTQEDPRPLSDAELRDEFNEAYRQVAELRHIVNDMARALASHEHSAVSGKALYPEITLGRPRKLEPVQRFPK